MFVLSVISLPLSVFPGPPTFEDFRRTDRAGSQALTLGRMTPDSLEVAGVDEALILRTAQHRAADPAILWGTAELLQTWGDRGQLRSP